MENEEKVIKEVREDKVEKLFNWFYDKFKINLSEDKKKLLIQIFKFVIVGGIATAIDFACLFVFKEYFHFSTDLANTLSFTISLIYNYIASTRWVFDVSKDINKVKSTVLFIVFSLIGLGINDGIVITMEDKMHIHYMIAKVVATGVVMVFNFITRKMFLEDKKQKA